ncbi:MAG: hypothetical protein A4S09_05570 [Proteobacteria bacterium SG_bin7]|nr:MAG: hypothetical protein A4S09_05570 [Proteobacteria bacterium SG_bin7]
MQKHLNIYDHVESVIDRLSQQIESKYNVGFKFFSSEQWRELEVAKNIPIATSLEPIRISIVVADADTYLPITINGELACTVKLTNTVHLTGAELSEISDVIDAFIGGSIALLNKAEALDQDLYFKEKHLREDVLDTEAPTNVVMMNKFSYLRKESHSEEVFEKKEVKEKAISDLPIFIHAKTEEQIKKIAHEIYTYTDKIACISITDLRKNNEDLTIEFIKSLGKIVLVIPEVACLSQESIDILTEYLLEQKRDANDDLLLIFGSAKSASELISSKKICLNFYRMISATRISHLEENLTQDQLGMHIESLLRSQKDLHVLTLLSQMGLSAFNVDDLV